MVNVQLTFVALFLLVSSTLANALPPSSIFGNVTRSGATTTFSIEPASGAFQSISKATFPSAGSTVLTSNAGVYNSAYVRDFGLPVGDTLIKAKISNPITAANLATAAMAVAKKASAFGIALAAGSALYDYLKDSGIGVDSSGTFNAPPQYLSSGSSTAACTEVSVGTTAYYHNTISNTNYSYQVMQNTAPKGSPCSYGCGGSINGYCSTSVVPATNGCSAAICRYDNVTIPSAVPITDTQAYNKLNNYSNYPGTSDADRLVKQIVDASPAMAPSYTSPGTISGPASVTQPDESTVSPDGSVSKKTTTTALGYPSPGTITATDTSTTTITRPDGSTTTATTQESTQFDPISFDDPTVIPNSSSTSTGGSAGGTTQTDCDKYPSSAGCANLGDAPAPDTLQTQTPTFSITPVSVGGSGSCPAAKTFNVSGHTYSLSFDYICQGAGMLSAVILAISWMIAGYIVFGSVRSN